MIQRKSIISAPVEALEFSIRVTNCLRQARIKTLGDLIQTPRENLLAYRNFGKKSLEEIEMKLREMGFSLPSITVGSHRFLEMNERGLPLSPRERKIIIGYYLNGQTLLEISKALQLTPERVRQIRITGVRKIQQKILYLRLIKRFTIRELFEYFIKELERYETA